MIYLDLCLFMVPRQSNSVVQYVTRHILGCLPNQKLLSFHEELFIPQNKIKWKCSNVCSR
ncbi:hypothetical protein LINPERPRIM_LOCUS34695, partial [Linum perenne]